MDENSKIKGYLEAYDELLLSDLYMLYGILIRKKVVKLDLFYLDNEDELIKLILKHKHHFKNTNNLDW